MKKITEYWNSPFLNNVLKVFALFALAISLANLEAIHRLQHDARVITGPEINAVAEAEAFCMTRIKTYSVKRRTCSFCLSSFKGKNAAECLDRADTYFRLDN